MNTTQLQEQLPALYLRLNGYFVSGFIVHAIPGGEQTNLTQVDALAVRFPHNAEPERGVLPSEYLQTSGDVTDILICEVKGGEEPLQFNRALRTNPAALRSVLRWVGAFTDTEIDTLVGPLKELLSPRETDHPDAFKTLACGGTYQLRGVLFALDRLAPRRNQPRYIDGEELIGHLWKCLREQAPRPECATRYDLGLWGPHEEIVRFFKEAPHEPTIKNIYDAFHV